MFDYNPSYAPVARIVLRYAVGAGLMGSEQIGEQLAANPDLVMVGAIAVGLAVEGLYAFAKSRGLAT